MRRVVAFVLLSAFLLQATGSASAAPASVPNSPSIGGSLLGAIVSVKGLFASTIIGALATGQVSRYAAMHAAPPVFPYEANNDLIDSATAHMVRAVRGTPQSGGRVDPPGTNAPPPTMAALRASQQNGAMASSQRPLAVFSATTARTAAVVRTQSVDTTVPSTTGFNPFWQYQSGAIPGAGAWFLNVATGNLMIQDTDLDISERGLDLTFGRTFNEQSNHDYANTDGSTMNNFGQGWTNEYDTHLGYDPARNVISWYDIDGARYDYNWNGTGWTPPAGQSATLSNALNCRFWLTKKSGAMYEFYAPAHSLVPSCLTATTYDGFLGRLEAIYARNQNNNIQLQYSWTNSDASTAANLSQIVAQHSDGHSLTLQFADFSGHRLLQSIKRPDGQFAYYAYDASANLTDVCDIGNGNIDNSAWWMCTDQTHQHRAYAYQNNHQIYFAQSPNWMMNGNSPGPNAPAGAMVGFANGFDANNRLIRIAYQGSVNFTPNDGTGATLQPVASGITLYRKMLVAYSSGLTQITDKDGHASNYTFDTLGRVTQRQAWQGSEYLVSNSTWDSQNRLVATTDAQGDETDYEYDAHDNLLSVLEPQVTTNAGTGRPTARFAYDGNDNLVATCDPEDVWTTGATVCSPGSIGATTYSYSSSSNKTDLDEPNGRLIRVTMPNGYHWTYTYDQSQQGGVDAGLVTLAQGDLVGVQADGSQRQPSIGRTYDQFGDVLTENNGGLIRSYTYDSENRVLSEGDASGHASFDYYNADDSLSKTETPLQHMTSTGTTYTYDMNGNEIQENLYRTADGQSTATIEPTKYWYDADDRLVEVQAPADTTSDAYVAPWTTRYLYDLTGGGSVGFNGSSFRAYGNLFKTQELLPAVNGPITMTSATAARSIANSTFQDLNGAAFDALDRNIARYRLLASSPSSSESTLMETFTYDTSDYFSGSLSGELTKYCNSAQPQQCIRYNYDSHSNETNVHFSDATSPDRSTVYDPDDRISTMSSTIYGTQSYAYDSMGHEVSEQEASSGSVTSPALFTHEFYPDGKFKQLDVSSSGLTQSGLSALSYTSAGQVQTHAINYAAQANVGSTLVSNTYDSTGRPTQRSESGPGANPNPSALTYDGSGSLASETFPSCSYCYQPVSPPVSGLQYDPQGEILTAGTTRFSYTTRGEMRGPLGSSYLANGYSVPLPPIPRGYTGYSSTSWDARSGAFLSSSSVLDDGSGNEVDISAGATYDGAGRMISDVTASVGNSTNRVFDAENHVISTSSTMTKLSSYGDFGTLALYNWGPAGHPVQIGSATGGTAAVPSASSVTFDTLHWDGDQLIFTTNQAGAVDDIKFGAEADITPLDPSFSGLTFWDRAPSGTVLGFHNSTGASITGSLNPYSSSTIWGGVVTGTDGVHTYASPSTILWNLTGRFGPLKFPVTAIPVGVGQGMLLGAARPDGLSDGLNVLQGVRSYDALIGQWTTPDSFGGSTDTPVTQKAYVWNNDNPMQMTDPTGFASSYGSCWNTDSLVFGNFTYQTECDPQTTWYYSPPIQFGDGPTNQQVHGGGVSRQAPRPSPPAKTPDCDPNGYKLPNAQFSDVYAAGVKNGPNSDKFKNATVPTNAPFNFQNQCECRAAGNFGLGVYASGAGIPEWQVSLAIFAVGALHNLTLGQIHEDQVWAEQGREWADKHCHK